MRPETKTLRDRERVSRRGFTLIEVLVVVAIIALLISILLPSLAAARERARNVSCLSHLEQQGKASFMYAHDWKGYLPQSFWHEAIEAITARSAKELDRMVSHHAEIFFCPENLSMKFRPQTPAEFRLALGDFDRTKDQGVYLGYWWVANPPPPPSAARTKYIDSDNDGRTDDEYLINLEQRDLHAVVISTDQSGQENRPGTGWYFFHGGDRAVGMHKTDTKGITTAWKNNLYGDGHAESVLGFKVKPRWGKIGTTSLGW